jgi:rubrerythrin
MSGANAARAINAPMIPKRSLDWKKATSLIRSAENRRSRHRRRHPEAPVFETKEILDLAIRFETNGEATYREAMRVCPDKGLQALLEWMAGEEALHARWFTELKDGLARGSRNPFLEEMGRELFRDVVGGQSFSLKEVDFAKVRSPGDLVAIFIEFERDTVLFYELIAPFVEEGGTRAQLEAIIAEENRHIERLTGFLESTAPAERVSG